MNKTLVASLILLTMNSLAVAEVKFKKPIIQSKLNQPIKVTFPINHGDNEFKNYSVTSSTHFLDGASTQGTTKNNKAQIVVTGSNPVTRGFSVVVTASGQNGQNETKEAFFIDPSSNGYYQKIETSLAPALFSEPQTETQTKKKTYFPRTIKSGDTLGRIAQNWNARLSGSKKIELLAQNNPKALDNGSIDRLIIGQTIRLPESGNKDTNVSRIHGDVYATKSEITELRTQLARLSKAVGQSQAETKELNDKLSNLQTDFADVLALMRNNAEKKAEQIAKN